MSLTWSSWAIDKESLTLCKQTCSQMGKAIESKELLFFGLILRLIFTPTKFFGTITKSCKFIHDMIPSYIISKHIYSWSQSKLIREFITISLMMINYYFWKITYVKLSRQIFTIYYTYITYQIPLLFFQYPINVIIISEKCYIRVLV